jgi:effector-binding domain-containing protein
MSNTTINEINELANELAVSRLLIEQYEYEIKSLPGYKDLIKRIEDEKLIKEQNQAKLIDIMKSNGLKSWKTDRATFSRRKTSYISIDPNYKMEIEKKVKNGESVKGWELKDSEYLSIRKINQK